MLKKIITETEKIKERLVTFRRELHRKPELSGKEEQTASFVAGVLEANDIEVKRGVGGHGVVGLLKGGKNGPLVALRADMDALPIQDKKSTDYASTVPGVMHACGHDVHVVSLLGAAIVLGKLRENIKGRVLFVFQPAEENSTGAKAMLKDGLFEETKPAAIAALHCLPELEVGQVGHRSGMMTAAADRVSIRIKGKSGHASRPHQTVDAVLVGSLVINALHHIVSRRTDPLHPSVISIGKIEGGAAENIIADRLEMEGTVRTLNKDLRTRMPELIEGTVKGVTDSMGAGYEINYSYECPSVVNDPELDELLREAAVDVVGEEGVIRLEDPMMGAEDFALFAEEVPGVLFRLGTGNKAKGLDASLHNSLFDVDEGSLLIGTKIMSWFAVSFLSSRAKG